jgi:single-strand DNA-binding protein
MANFNKVFLMGNLTRDPELRYTPNGTSLCEFGMATNRTYTTRDGEKREEACFVDVTMWGRRGEVISEYLTKGQPIFVEGRLKFDTWETAEGKRSKLSVVAENFEFISGPGSGGGGRSRGGSGRSERSQAPSQAQNAPRQGSNSSPDRGAGQTAEPTPPDEESGYDVSDDEIPF